MVGFGKGLNLAVFAVLVSSAVCAQEPETTGVTTNYWIATGGTEEKAWSDPANWQDGSIGTRNSFADFTSVEGNSSLVVTGRSETAGLILGNAPDVTTWFGFRNMALYLNDGGHSSICVTGGVADVNLSLAGIEATADVAGGVVRKTGEGTLRLGYTDDWSYTRRVFQIAEGDFIIKNPGDFFWSDIVLQGTGNMLFDSPDPHCLGSLSFKDDRELDLNGHAIALGSIESGNIPAQVKNGSVYSVGGNTLYVTNTPTANMRYVAREGDVSFLKSTPFEGVVAWWDFNDAADAGRDLSVKRNHLFVSNSVAVVNDPERGSVVYFDGKGALYGQAENGGLRDLPCGGDAYTIAAWIKVPTGANSAGALFFWGVADQILLNRLNVDPNGALQIFCGHEGGTAVWGTGLAWNEWQHYAVTFDGTTLRVYVNGTPTGNCSYSKAQTRPNANFSLGRPWSASASYYKGYMDDAVIVNRVLTQEELARLRETGVTCSLESMTLPESTQLGIVYNGKIALGGQQRIRVPDGGGVRGGIEMGKTDSELTMDAGGTSAYDVKNYAAGISGTGAFVKDGDGTLALSGVSTYMGATRVDKGRLVVGRKAAVPYAVYDFENADNLGLDRSANRYDLNNNGVTQAVDAVRGKVAGLSEGTELSATFHDKLMYGNSSYTVSVWAKPSALCPNEGSFISFGKNTGGSGIQVQFRYNQSFSKLVLAHWGGFADFSGIQLANTSLDGNWHHYVAVHEGTNYAVYCDGVCVTTKTAVRTDGKGPLLNFPEETEIHIGSFFNSSSHQTRYFDGLIDDVVLYTEALSEEEVLQLYNNQQLTVASKVEVPQPIIHYAFEDEGNLGLDSSPNACNMNTVGNLTCVESPIGGHALRFDRAAPSYLTRPCPLGVLPVSNQAFTVSFWFEADPDLAGGENYPALLSWENPTEGTIGLMVAYWYQMPWRLRLYLKYNNTQAYDLDSKQDVLGLLTSGQGESRLHHYATTYSPNGIVDTYIDGQWIPSMSYHDSNRKLTAVKEEGAIFSIGYRWYSKGTRRAFKGIMDEVKVYDVALSQEQIRAAIRAEQTGHSLPPTTTVNVAEGASLVVKGAAQPVAGVSGTGEVSVQDGTLELTGASTFDGAVTGNGMIKIAAGASVEFSKGMGAFTGTVALDGGKLTMPTTGTASAATFVLKNGVSITLDATSTEPFIVADGKISILGGGTVTLSPAVVAGTWVIACGKSTEDKGTGDLSTRWSVTDLPASKKAKFRLTDSGDFVLSVSGAGTLVIFR